MNLTTACSTPLVFVCLDAICLFVWLLVCFLFIWLLFVCLFVCLVADCLFVCLVADCLSAHFNVAVSSYPDQEGFAQ